MSVFGSACAVGEQEEKLESVRLVMRSTSPTLTVRKRVRIAFALTAVKKSPQPLIGARAKKFAANVFSSGRTLRKF